MRLRFLFLLLMFFSFELSAKSKICLNMIVKDEEAVITRCLASVKPYIDYWVIVDTGSTDRTKEVIREFLKDLPGELIERPWKNFGYNRSEAFDLAKGKGDYLLLIDADDWLEYDLMVEKGAYPFPELTKDAYHMWRGSKDFAYLTPQLIKANLPWKYVGVTHEYLGGPQPHSTDILAHVRYISGDGGARSKGIGKFLKNIDLLIEGLKDEPDNERYMFYLAESYRDAGQPENAIIWYEKRVSMGRWAEEVFCSLLNIAKLKEQLKAPFHELVLAYYRAHAYRPHRPEPVYYLTRLYNQNLKWDLAYETSKAWLSLPHNQPKDALFNEVWTEKWGIPFEFSICASYVGAHQESLDACNQLLSAEGVPGYVRDRTILNRQFPLRALFPGNAVAKEEAVKEKASEKAPEIVSASNTKVKKYPKGKKVLIAILAKDKAHVLPQFLRCIEALDYDKRLITIYINTNNNFDNTEEVLRAWAKKNEKKYHAIDFEKHEVAGIVKSNPHLWTPEKFKILGAIRNKSLQKTKEYGCDFYFTADCDNFIAPFTLKDLVAKNLPIVAPMIMAIPLPYDHYTNYFCDVDENGYYKHHPKFFPILNREIKGTFAVPLVHMTYLIKAEHIDKLTYIDGTQHHECIIFSRSARDHHVQQYICNEKEYGVFLHFDDLSSKVSVEDEKNYFEHYLRMKKYCNQLNI